MTPGCLILLAGLCLPPKAERIDFHGGMVVEHATATFRGATIRFEIETDLVVSSRHGFRRTCSAGACLQHRDDPLAAPEFGRSFALIFPGEEAPRTVSIRAPDTAALVRALAETKVLVGQGRGAALIPLAHLLEAPLQL